MIYPAMSRGLSPGGSIFWLTPELHHIALRLALKFSPAELSVPYEHTVV